MQNCNEFEALIERYIDNELLDKEKEEFENHMTECISCREELEFSKEIREILNTTKFPEPPKDFINRVNSRIDAEIAQKKVYDFKKYFMSRKYQTVAACFIIAAFLGVSAEKMIEDVNINNNALSGDNQIVVSEVVTPTNTPEVISENPTPENTIKVSKNTPKPRLKKTEAPKTEVSPPDVSVVPEVNDNNENNENNEISIASFTEAVPIDGGPGPRMIDAPVIYDDYISVSPNDIDKVIVIIEKYSKSENDVYEMPLEDFKAVLDELSGAEIEFVSSVEEKDPMVFRIIEE